jgi:transposase-like protein
MRQKSNSTPVTSEKLVRNIRRATRKHHAAEEKIRIVLDGLRGESSIAELCRREGIADRQEPSEALKTKTSHLKEKIAFGACRPPR